MPKNKGKGGKNRKRGKNEADDEKRELVFKEDGQEYAQDDKADVILKYMPDEARLLKAYGELPENTRLNDGIIDDEEDGGGDDYIEFEDEDIDKI
ncbi:hypothetical protein SO802_015350 [Lithocarpus litseifolius]|uniref:Eukaryotic translation initiation factor 1A n=1 Tax=Lithocarpus litseifolius TaxID=425828 RepID=A0AAW2CVU5_9ROSI